MGSPQRKASVGGGASGRRGGRGAARRRRPIVFGHEEGYARLSTQPLHVLAFLAPLLVLYEIGSAIYLSGAGGGWGGGLGGGGGGDGTARMIRAEGILTQFFRWFGVGGLYLPGIAMVAALLIWHALTRARWTVRLPVLGWMLVESACWTLPLIVLLQFVGRLAHGDASAAAIMAGVGGVGGLSVGERATIAIGAGLYEELLFRMLMIAGIHLVAADLLRVRDRAARVAAVALSAGAFALYHDVTLPGGALDWGRLVIFFLAGLYFGTIYVARGFGIVVATHALYDLFVLVLLRSGR